jgi:molecular chaperone HscB
VQDPPKVDYFTLLSEPHSLKLDVKELEKRFKRLQRLLHPDKHTFSNEKNKDHALRASTVLNQAYQALRDPLARMHYLLALYGAHVSEETVGKNLDQDFLTDMMERMEDVAAMKKDTPEYNRAVDENEDQIADLYVLAAECVEQRDWSGAQQAAMKINYLNRIRTMLDEK